MAIMLNGSLIKAVNFANDINCLKISLDLPTGFDKLSGSSIFLPDIILTLAAMKKELLPQADFASIYIADLGIPSEIYTKFNISQPEKLNMESPVTYTSNLFFLCLLL